MLKKFLAIGSAVAALAFASSASDAIRTFSSHTARWSARCQSSPAHSEHRDPSVNGETPALAGVSWSAPERIRTSDLRFRRPTLYPAELRAQRSGKGV